MDTTRDTRTPEDVARLLRSKTYAVANEAELHTAVAETLADDGYDVRAEVRLNAHDRIDLEVSLGSGMLGTELGIEIKVQGNPSAVLSQLTRYAASIRLDALMILTTQRRHLRILPDTLGGKPLHRVLLRAAL